jgi:Sulfatase-modifying factor enzyme 1
MPVINVSFDDAKHAGWLSRVTGKAYRLLTEAECEYVARAGTTTRYYWGDDIGKGNADCDGCGSKWDNKQTAPVGSFKPNAFRLYDMAGNVCEWFEDVWHNNYEGAPTDGSAWIQGGDKSRRVVRGGSWRKGPLLVRAATRVSDAAGARGNALGFRVGGRLLLKTFTSLLWGSGGEASWPLPNRQLIDVAQTLSLRGAQRRSNPETGALPGLLRLRLAMTFIVKCRRSRDFA